MRAAIIEQPRIMTVDEQAKPEAEPGGLLLRVGACAICGTDLRILNYGHHRVRLPAVIGHEIAGTVADVGSGVEGYAVGDRVVLSPPGWSCGTCRICGRGEENLCESRQALSYEYAGGFAEYVAIPSALVGNGSLHRVPADADLAHVAITEPLACCVNGQDQVRWRPDDRVLIIGGGPIGMMHSELVRSRGAEAVAMVDVSDERLRLIRSLGDVTAVDGRDPRAAEQISSWSGGFGPDVVIVATSAPAAYHQAFGVVGRGGRVLLFAGLPKDNQVLDVNMNLIHYRQLTWYGAFGSTPAHGRQALDLLLSKKVNAERLVSHRFSLDRIPEAFAAAGALVGLKVVVEP